MQTEGPMNQRENKITNFFDQRNDDTNEIAPPGNGSVMEPEGKENKKEFNYVNQDSIKVGESSGKFSSACKIDCPLPSATLKCLKRRVVFPYIPIKANSRVVLFRFSFFYQD